MEDLFSHPIYGPSYEGYVIENILTQSPRWQASYFRTSNGTEIDLILTKGMTKIAIEIKSSTSPKVSKSFWNAIETIGADKAVVIAPVERAYPIGGNVTVMPLGDFSAVLYPNVAKA